VDKPAKISLSSHWKRLSGRTTLVYSILFAAEEAYGFQGASGRMGGRPTWWLSVVDRLALIPGKKLINGVAKETGGGFLRQEASP